MVGGAETKLVFKEMGSPAGGNQSCYYADN
jgi:hypothetical protein